MAAKISSLRRFLGRPTLGIASWNIRLSLVRITGYSIRLIAAEFDPASAWRSLLDRETGREAHAHAIVPASPPSAWCFT